MVIKTEAHKNLGVAELLAAVLDHRDYLRQEDGQRLAGILAPRLRRELVDLILQGIKEKILPRILADSHLEQTLADIVAKKTDPYSVSDDIVARLLSTTLRT